MMLRSFLIGLLLSIPLTAALAQTASPSPAESKPAASPSVSPPDSTANDRYLREGMKDMADESRALTGWGLTIIGASILAIASTSYLRPLSRRVRFAYLLFIPGWLFIAFSVYNGNKISRRYPAATFAQKRETLLKIGDYMNTEFASQLTYFQWGLLFFSAWLLFYISWWVFVDLPAKTD